jgi:mono/diheme cytochrome c family protein
MNRLLLFFSLAIAASAPGTPVDANERAAAQKRGAQAVSGRIQLTPPVWSKRSYDSIWRRWGLQERPADFDNALRQRYGLLPAPGSDHGLPLGLNEVRGVFGSGIANNCLLCHAGTVAGKMHVGLGNASLDLQGLSDDLFAGENYPFKLPIYFSHVRGTIDPVSPVAYLAGFRDADLNLVKNTRLDYFDNLASDPPAWWLLKKKKTRNWTGGVDARSIRVDMVNLLSPFNSAAFIKKQESLFADIHAFILSVNAPTYPFHVDAPLAAKGRQLFNENCSRCHGTYGPQPTYPNKIVPLETIGTDPALARALTKKNMDFFIKSWFAREPGPDGKPLPFRDYRGYQAPPLDGVWATAPYFHNGSVPTVYHVLNSRARPRIYTRSFRTGPDEYDTAKLGWKITVLDKSPDPSVPGVERRKIYDTTQPGRTNVGHTFGDHLTDPERHAVIEYLKTL